MRNKMYPVSDVNIMGGKIFAIAFGRFTFNSKFMLSVRISGNWFHLI